MFWKSQAIKVGGPMGIPAYIGKHVVTEMQKIPQGSDHWVNYMMVVRPQSGKPDTYDVRVIDEWETREKGKEVAVTNYDFLDTHPELVKFEGWFNSKTHEVHIQAKLPVAGKGPEKG